ncbi:hypothetical protein HS088_TW01G00640 [Tripterygium wilfordii]|uniref:Uncharacterized protein n=1 Tax=Tripterygium wilfordii TaxID=458696 RepID=A0A7J7E2P6_TRIWF|nr:hypothetical protein HS088_TW01G00640 [Tripterygium wilfordii]
MATSRIAKFISEVAPPQYVSVMRSRASKMLDTINEDRVVGTYGNDSLASSPKSPSSLSPSSSASASTTTLTTAVAAASASASHSRPSVNDGGGVKAL